MPASAMLSAKPGNRFPDCRTGIVIDARQDVRGARNGADAVGRCHAGHRQRHFEIFRTVVDSRQQMAVQINQFVTRFVVRRHNATGLWPRKAQSRLPVVN